MREQYEKCMEDNYYRFWNMNPACWNIDDYSESKKKLIGKLALEHFNSMAAIQNIRKLPLDICNIIIKYINDPYVYDIYLRHSGKYDFSSA